ncbi:hypothetical protein RJT34_02407 [Clitoria ternatea]|uniref:Uncharacterized protein n=1 Tax=Clitoria ternatea TaxID=43366 RepID=A0AAN9Q3W4_CLITE
MYMKKETVKMRPMARVKMESVGYHESGTGLVIGSRALHKKLNQKIEKKLKKENKMNEIKLPSQNAQITKMDLAPLDQWVRSRPERGSYIEFKENPFFSVGGGGPVGAKVSVKNMKGFL